MKGVDALQRSLTMVEGVPEVYLVIINYNAASAIIFLSEKIFRMINITCSLKKEYYETLEISHVDSNYRAWKETAEAHLFA